MIAVTSFLGTTVAEGAEIGTNPDLTWGITAAETDRTLALMQDSGVEWVRLNVSWRDMEPDRKGSYSSWYLEDIDEVVQRVRAAGINVVMPMADWVPYWASADPNKSDASGKRVWNPKYRPTRFSDYADAIAFLARRYSQQGVHVYEVWNEPDISRFWPSGPNAAEYAEMLRVAYPAIKAADPSATVLAGALSRNNYEYLEALYRAGAKANFDAISTHSYPTGGPGECWNVSGRPSREAFCSLDEVRRVMVANGDAQKQIWLDELGWSTCSNEHPGCYGKGVTEAQQARYLTDALTMLGERPWVEAALLYNFRNTYWKQDDPRDFDATTGLLNTDFTPKPAYEAVKAYSREASPTDPSQPGVPAVSLTAPVQGTVFDKSLEFAAEASDDIGVVRVEFLINGILVATDEAAPYEAVVDGGSVAYGSHEVSARAFDADGASAISSVTVKRARKSSAKLKLASKGRSAGRVRGARGRVLKATGKVSGAAAGKVSVRLKRRGSSRVRVRRVNVDSDGRYGVRLGKARPGTWVARARYRGSEQHPPSRRMVKRVRIRGT